MTTSSCPSVDFPGQDKFIQAIDTAIAAGDQHAVTAAVRNALCRLIKDRDVRLPECVHDPIVDHYARRELYRSPEHGYSVVAMTWGPGQGTPLHDHSGLWCVEGVWDGELEITQYELLENDGERFRFRAGAGSLIPPHEYHTIRNASADAVAISLHIYKAEMACCAKFIPERRGTADEWFVREDAALKTDQAA